MKTNLTYVSFISGILLLMTSLFYSCKKENIEKNSSQVQVAIVGAQTHVCDTNANFNEITLEGVFIADSEFEIGEFGAVLYDDVANLNSGDHLALNTETRNKPGSFTVVFLVSASDNRFVKLYAKAKQGIIYSGNYNKVNEIKEEAKIEASLAGTTLVFKPGETIDFGTQTSAIPMAVRIKNVGIKVALALSNIKVDTFSKINFSLASSTSMSMGPTQTGDIVVSLNAALPGEYICSISMNTNDALYPTAQYYLRINYQPVAPSPLKLIYGGTDFLPESSFDMSMVSYLDLTLMNISPAPFQLYSIKVMDSTGYYIEGATGLPLQLDNNGTKYFTVGRSASSPTTLKISTSLGDYVYYLNYTEPALATYSLHPNLQAPQYSDLEKIIFTPFQEPLFLDIANQGDLPLEINSIGTTNENLNVSNSGPFNVAGKSRFTFSISHAGTYEDSAGLIIDTKLGQHNYSVIYKTGFKMVDSSGYNYYDGAYINMYNSLPSITLTIFNNSGSNFAFDASLSDNTNFSLNVPASIPNGGSADLVINASGYGTSTLNIPWGTQTFSYTVYRPLP